MKVKLNKSGSDCRFQDYIVCPYCGYIDEDSWEYAEDGECQDIECRSCGRKLELIIDITIDFTTRPIIDLQADKDKIQWHSWRKGEIVEDGLNEEDEKLANENGDMPCEVVK